MRVSPNGERRVADAAFSRTDAREAGGFSDHLGRFIAKNTNLATFNLPPSQKSNKIPEWVGISYFLRSEPAIMRLRSLSILGSKIALPLNMA